MSQRIDSSQATSRIVSVDVAGESPPKVERQLPPEQTPLQDSEKPKLDADSPPPPQQQGVSKVFEKFQAEEGIPRSSRVLSTKEARPKLSVSRRAEKKQESKEIEISESESDQQDSETGQHPPLLVTEAETGQEMKDKNKGKPGVDVMDMTEQASTPESPTVESGEKSLRRSSEVIHKKKGPRVVRLSERKARRTVIQEESEGGNEDEQEDSEARFRKVRAQERKHGQMLLLHTYSHIQWNLSKMVAVCKVQSPL